MTKFLEPIERKKIEWQFGCGYCECQLEGITSLLSEMADGPISSGAQFRHDRNCGQTLEPNRDLGQFHLLVHALPIRAAFAPVMDEDALVFTHGLHNISRAQQIGLELCDRARPWKPFVKAAQSLEDVAIHQKAKSVGDHNGIVIDRTQAGGSAEVCVA
jgi:hypothetical protein